VNKESSLDTWGIVELFGHVKMAGMLSEQVVAGTTMLRLDVPEVEDKPAFTRFYGSGAVYSITPTEESIARQAAAVLRARPVTVYGIVAPERQLEAGFVDDDGYDAGDEEDWDEEEGDDELDTQVAMRQKALSLLAAHPVFLDTETTGLLDVDEVVEVAVLDTDGTVLLNTLVKPTRLIGEGACQVHGINDADVEDAPTFAEIWPQLIEVLQDRQTVIYNASFDMQKLRQSARAHGLQIADSISLRNVHCAMEMYASFWGDWDDYHESYRWQSLSDAAAQQGVKIPLDLHRARGDAELTRQVFLKIAGEDDVFGD
jgi:DNA polymerase-3 subunit epsilon